MSQSPYTRGERVLFYGVDALLGLCSDLMAWLAALVVAYAGVAAAAGVLAWLSSHDAALARQFLTFGLFLALYALGPLGVLFALAVFAHHGWRCIWGATGVLAEREMPAVFVVVLLLAGAMLTAAAHQSLGGKWGEVPAHLASTLGIARRTEAPSVPAAPARTRP